MLEGSKVKELCGPSTHPSLQGLFASMSAILPMVFMDDMIYDAHGSWFEGDKKPSSMVLVNDGNFLDSILFQHELPAIGWAAWGKAWSPEILLIDRSSNCSTAALAQLFSDIGWEYLRYSLLASKSRPQWKCLECPAGSCSLDQKLADHVKEIVKEPSVSKV